MHFHTLSTQASCSCKYTQQTWTQSRTKFRTSRTPKGEFAGHYASVHRLDKPKHPGLPVTSVTFSVQVLPPDVHARTVCAAATKASRERKTKAKKAWLTTRRTQATCSSLARMNCRTSRVPLTKQLNRLDAQPCLGCNIFTFVPFETRLKLYCGETAPTNSSDLQGWCSGILGL